MEWKFFLGACFLTAMMLLPHASLPAVVAGMVLGATIYWGACRRS
jgi:hypothetical protein